MCILNIKQCITAYQVKRERLLLFLFANLCSQYVPLTPWRYYETCGLFPYACTEVLYTHSMCYVHWTILPFSYWFWANLVKGPNMAGEGRRSIEGREYHPRPFSFNCLVLSRGQSCSVLFFCFCFSLKEFALTSPEKSTTKETERKETTAEEELDSDVLEVFHPSHEWQALRPGTNPSPVPMKHILNSNCIYPLSPQGSFEGAASLWPAGGKWCASSEWWLLLQGLGTFIFQQNRGFSALKGRQVGGWPSFLSKWLKTFFPCTSEAQERQWHVPRSANAILGSSARLSAAEILFTGESWALVWGRSLLLLKEPVPRNRG